MNNLINKLKILKNFGVVAIKQSLEDEGASFEDLTFMRKLTKKLDLKLNVKIGGCEAKNDIFFCHSIFANGIVAPMVESEYALKKFIQTVPSSFKGDLYVNLESKNAISNLNKILDKNEFKKLKGVVIGRSDLAGSLDLTKKEVDSRKILNLMEHCLKKIKKNKKLVKMGGSITKNSKSFISILFKKKLIDRIETRNIELKLNDKIIKNFDMIISLVFNFETDWLRYKYKKFKLNKIVKRSILKRISEIDKREKILLNA
jgi:4-hydroxy-2-oxoheptanedioate aldolase